MQPKSSVGQAVMVKRTENRVLQAKYFGLAIVENTFPNKMYVFCFDGTEINRPKSSLKLCEFLQSTSAQKVTTNDSEQFKGR